MINLIKDTKTKYWYNFIFLEQFLTLNETNVFFFEHLVLMRPLILIIDDILLIMIFYF